MNQQLESDLREAFALRASQLPAEPGERIRGTDYRPRQRRTSPKITLLSIGGAAATTGVVASVVILGSSQPAFAGWSPTPTHTSAVLTATADSTCRSRLGMPVAPGAAPTTGWKEVATDVRGPFTLSIYQNGNADATCLVGPSITFVSQQAANGSSASGSASGSASLSGGVTNAHGDHGGDSTSVMFGGTGTGDIPHLSVAHLDATGQGPYTLVDGQVASGVTAVTIDRSQGALVQASTDNGWFLAWWPGSASATAAEVTTAGGVVAEPLGLRAPGTPPAGAAHCSSGTPGASGTTCSGSGPA